MLWRSNHPKPSSRGVVNFARWCMMVNRFVWNMLHVHFDLLYRTDFLFTLWYLQYSLLLSHHRSTHWYNDTMTFCLIYNILLLCNVSFRIRSAVLVSFQVHVIPVRLFIGVKSRGQGLSEILHSQRLRACSCGAPHSWRWFRTSCWKHQLAWLKLVYARLFTINNCLCTFPASWLMDGTTTILLRTKQIFSKLDIATCTLRMFA